MSNHSVQQSIAQVQWPDTRDYVTRTAIRVLQTGLD